MLFSEHYNFQCVGDEEWFNPILSQDNNFDQNGNTNISLRIVILK